MGSSICVTGGAGFIGSHVVRLFVNAYPDYHIINLDKLTYAGNLANIDDVIDDRRCRFVHADICDQDAVTEHLPGHDAVVHFAGLKAVGESTGIPLRYYENNITGTLNLLEAIRIVNPDIRFYQASTSEMFGKVLETPRLFRAEPLGVGQALFGRRQLPAQPGLAVLGRRRRGLQLGDTVVFYRDEIDRGSRAIEFPLCRGSGGADE
mgnify:CR=1 FL=1